MAKISICPKCNSAEIHRDTVLSGWLLPEKWICDKCGYAGILVKEIDTEDIKKPKHKL
jgi:predicted nucleic-acid-binding Zn-ribbon protein